MSRTLHSPAPPLAWPTLCLCQAWAPLTTLTSPTRPRSTQAYETALSGAPHNFIQSPCIYAGHLLAMKDLETRSCAMNRRARASSQPSSPMACPSQDWCPCTHRCSTQAHHLGFYCHRKLSIVRAVSQVNDRETPVNPQAFPPGYMPPQMYWPGVPMAAYPGMQPGYQQQLDPRMLSRQQQVCASATSSFHGSFLVLSYTEVYLLDKTKCREYTPEV